MNTHSSAQRASAGASARAFTLVEMLTVIGVIAVLAAMIIPITGAVNKAKVRNKTRAELETIRTAIEQYHTKLGHYPPDNPGNVYANQLYFELIGTTLDNTGLYKTLDGAAWIPQGGLGKAGPFQRVAGFVNSNRAGSNGDDAPLAQNFLKGGVLKPGMYGELSTPVAGSRVLLLTGSVLTFPATGVTSTTANQDLNPWRYNSSTPTNNPNSYDLWIDVLIDGKTNRICNWSSEPLINP